jgi:hypothetical protein
MADQPGYDAAAGRLFLEFLRRTHLSEPSDLATLAAEEAATFGFSDVAIYLVDYEQRQLRALPAAKSPHSEPVTSDVVEGESRTPGRRRLFLPLLDGTERLGTIELTTAATNGAVGRELVTIAERYAHLVAQTVLTKGLYGDTFEHVRRTRPMSVATELIRGLLPPLVFATDNLVLSAMLEPAYDAGGDTFDYAVNDGVAHLAIFDAMGHGLAAAGDACFAVAAYRAARRRDLGLVDTYLEMDDAICRQTGDRYVTAVLAELQVATGELRWLSAGHPPPLLIREAKLVKTLDSEPSTPLGVAFGEDAPVVSKESLQPGDLVLLYTDGVPEARLADGNFFTTTRLAEFIERQAAAENTAPETLRRLRHAILEHQQGRLQDDATAVLVEWARGSERRLIPATVS